LSKRILRSKARRTQAKNLKRNRQVPNATSSKKKGFHKRNGNQYVQAQDRTPVGDQKKQEEKKGNKQRGEKGLKRRG